MALTNRTLILFKYFWEATDEAHPVSLADISAQLKEHGITADPRTLRNDIEQLVEFGVDIVKDRRVQNLYHVEKQGAGQTADALCRSRRRRADGTASLHRQPRKSHQRGRLHQRRPYPDRHRGTEKDRLPLLRLLSRQGARPSARRTDLLRFPVCPALEQRHLLPRRFPRTQAADCEVPCRPH